MIGYFKELISPRNGQSSARFAFLFSILLSNIVVWGTWLVVCVYKKDIINIPDGVVMAYAAAQGLSFIGKVGQRFAERGEGNNDTNKNLNIQTQKTTFDVY